MVLYSASKLLQNGLIKKDSYSQDMLKQSKFYFLPILNVDGVALIEQQHQDDGKIQAIMDKRKNMGPAGIGGEDGKQSCLIQHSDGKEFQKCFDCPGKMQGTDLNRNYGIDWTLNKQLDPCSETYPGKEPFSEKETQAIR